MLRARRIAAGKNKLVPGAKGLYLFNEGTGTTLTDYSGNGNHGTFGAGGAAPSWTSAGVAFDTDEYIELPAMLAGKTAATVIVVANVTSSVANAGLIGPVSTAAANFSLLIRDYTSSTDNIRIATSDGTNAKAVDLPTKLSATYEMITGRFLSSTYLKIRKGLSSDSSSTEAIPAILNTDTTKLLYLGRSETGYLTGTICAVVIYDRALSDAEVAQNYNYLKKILAIRGVTVA